MSTSLSRFVKRHKTKLLFFLILLLAVLLRVQYLDKSLQKDESPFFHLAENLYAKGSTIHLEKYLFDGSELVKSLSRSPLFAIYLSQVVRVFSLNEVALRLSMVIPSVLTVVLMYFVGTTIGDKKLGLLSAFLLAISRLHVEHSQIIDTDGSILTFLTLLSVFFLLKLWKSDKSKYLVLSSITIAAAFLVKEPILLIFPPLFLYYFQKRNLTDFFAILALSMAISIVSLLIFGYFYSTDFLAYFIRWINGFVFHRAANVQYYQGRIYQYVGISIWDLTLPFIILFIFSIFHAFKSQNAFKFLAFFSIVFLAFNTLIMGITKYHVPIIPIMCLLVANFILNSRIFNKKTIPIILLLTILLFTSFYLLRIRTDATFLIETKANLRLILIPFVLPIAPLLLYFTSHKKLALLVLFGMLIGYNVYFAQEAVNPLVSPDYGKVSTNAANFIIANATNGPVVTNQDIAFYSNKPFYDILAPFMSVQYLENLIKQNTTVYVVYRTDIVIVQQSIKEFLDSNCQKIGSKVSRNVEVFKAYKCSQ